jgi:hypothetical protein
MGRNQRPPVARHGMIRTLTVFIAVLLAGCGGQSNVQVNSGGGYTSSASVPGFSRLGTLLSLVFLGAVSYESDRDMARGGHPAYSLHAPGIVPPPELDPSRRIVEHDCTKPIEDWSANLKCR